MAEPDDYDNPWKQALEGAFPEFMAFYFPEAAARIAWERGHEFLDQELRQVVRDAESGKRHVDKLARVLLLDGQEDWIYIHIEVQGSDEAAFAERMFVYHYRLFDRYRRPVASLAVLADEAPNWRPSAYAHELFGCRLDFAFPAVKLLDYQPRLAGLMEESNPFAWITAAHLLTQQTRGDPASRFNAKFMLVRRMYQRGWTRQRVIDLFAVLDWMMRLPKDLDRQLWQEINLIEERQRMRYVTSVERFYQEKWKDIGLEEGRQEGRQEGESKLLRKLLERRFGALPPWAGERIAAAGEEELERWAENLLAADSLDAVFD